jgi:hypothetical protein
VVVIGQWRGIRRCCGCPLSGGHYHGSSGIVSLRPGRGPSRSHCTLQWLGLLIDVVIVMVAPGSYLCGLGEVVVVAVGVGVDVGVGVVVVVAVGVGVGVGIVVVVGVGVGVAVGVVVAVVVVPCSGQNRHYWGNRHGGSRVVSLRPGRSRRRCSLHSARGRASVSCLYVVGIVVVVAGHRYSRSGVMPLHRGRSHGRASPSWLCVVVVICSQRRNRPCGPRATKRHPSPLWSSSWQQRYRVSTSWLWS